MLLRDLLQESNSLEVLMKRLKTLKEEKKSLESKIAMLPFASPAIQTLKNQIQRINNEIKTVKAEIDYINDQPRRDEFEKGKIEANKNFDLTSQVHNKGHSLDNEHKEKTQHEKDPDDTRNFDSDVMSAAQRNRYKREEEIGDRVARLEDLFKTATEINNNQFEYETLANLYGVKVRTVRKWLEYPEASFIRRHYGMRPKRNQIRRFIRRP